MSDYDVVVIGTGTAGQSAAYELKANGLTVAVVEKSTTPEVPAHLPDARQKSGSMKPLRLPPKPTI